MNRIIVILMSLLLWQFALHAEGRMQVTHLTIRDGLPHDVVYCSHKAKDGFMWFGTWYGLTRFDGINFDNFSRVFNYVSDQPPRKVESIVEDANGNLWVKTLDWKLTVFYKKQERFEEVLDELKPYTRNLQIIKMQSDNRGGVLLLTKDKTLLLAKTTADGEIVIKKLADTRAERRNTKGRLVAASVQCREGRANYVGTNFEIYSVPLSAKTRHWDEQAWLGYFARLTEKSQTYYTKGGLVWRLSSDGTAFLCLNAQGRELHRYPVSTQRTNEPQFIATPQNGYFYLTAAGEVLHIDPVTFEAENMAKRRDFIDFKENSRFLSMRMDGDNVLWLTSATSGIYRINFVPDQFRVTPLPNGDVSGVRSLFQMNSGNVLVGARSKTFYEFDAKGKLLKAIPYTQNHIGSVYHIMQDSKGRIWLSTKGDGLVLATRNSVTGQYDFEAYKHDNASSSTISGNNVYMTYEDSRHSIWVATLDGGLNLVNESDYGITFFNKDYGMKHYPRYGLFMDVRNMVEDAQGRMWVGTIDGLMTFNGAFSNIEEVEFETFRSSKQATRANGDINALYKDRQNNVWMCSFGGGLSRLDGIDAETNLPILRYVGQRNGLANDIIVSLVEDRRGRLWLASGDGISCFNHTAGNIRCYDKSDGFPTVQLEESSALCLKDGSIWLGSKEGIVTFHPDRLSRARAEYPIYIIGGEVNNKDIRETDNSNVVDGSIVYADYMELRHDQSMFTLQFAALNYDNPDHITYRYRLQGYDHDWHYTGKLRLASFTNVPSGVYTFTVEAIDATNPDIHSQRSITIRILPPWWATWWAYTIYVVLFVAAVYVLVRYAQYQIRLKNDIYIQTKLAEYKKRYAIEERDKQFVADLNTAIADHITDTDFDIDFLAKQMGMSRSAFFKKVKAVTGLSPADVVKDYKLNRAVDLLKHSSDNITDIAYKCGFTDVSYFGKCFRKKFGISPREYVNQSATSSI